MAASILKHTRAHAHPLEGVMSTSKLLLALRGLTSEDMRVYEMELHEEYDQQGYPLVEHESDDEEYPVVLTDDEADEEWWDY